MRHARLIGCTLTFGLLAGMSVASTSAIWPEFLTSDARSTGSSFAQAQDKESVPVVQVRVFDSSGELVGPIELPKVVKTQAEWRRQLTADQFRITRRAGTEPPFCGTLLDNKQEGVYACVCCSLPLFSSAAKFDSGTGWPSFFQPVARENVGQKPDFSHGMVRTEIVCVRCDAHLGHVFNDGPRPTGLRFCLNSEALTFTHKDQLASLADPDAPEPASGR